MINFQGIHFFTALLPAQLRRHFALALLQILNKRKDYDHYGTSLQQQNCITNKYSKKYLSIELSSLFLKRLVLGHFLQGSLATYVILIKQDFVISLGVSILRVGQEEIIITLGCGEKPIEKSISFEKTINFVITSRNYKTKWPRKTIEDVFL